MLLLSKTRRGLSRKDVDPVKGGEVADTIGHNLY